MILEPEGERAKRIVPFLTNQVNKLPAKKTGNGNTFTLEINTSRLDTMPNEFQSIEMSMSLLGVLGNQLSGMEKKQKKPSFKILQLILRPLLKGLMQLKRKPRGLIVNTSSLSLRN
jgi:hypothetical protein